jgi:hypothetical protein
MRVYISLVIIIIWAYGQPATAQEMLGVTLGNYAGINSTQLNPSALHNSKQYLDVQLLGMDVFIQNNYLYQAKEDYSFWNFFKTGYEFPVHTEDYGTEERIFYTYENGRNKSMFLNYRVNGPGAMFIWDRHAVALTTALRSNVSMTSVPQDIANFMYLGLNYVPQHNINYIINQKFGSAAASWGEIGLTYSYLLYQKRYDRISVGASVKRLMGLAGAYLAVDQMDYVVPDDSTMIVNNMDARMGFSAPMDYNTNEFVSGNWIKGGGFGFDFGATYTRTLRSAYKQYIRRPCEARYDDYLYRIGVAILDVGRIKFKTNAQDYAIDNRSSYWSDVNELDFESVNQFMDTVSYQFYGDYTSSYRGDVIRIWLPSALSVQFDYHYLGPWYVNASLIYGFPLSRSAVRRPAVLSVTPRYESGWFEASLPLTLYDWYLPRIGLALRFYFLTIGTEKLGQFFSISDFTGLDLYFSVKIPIDKGSCGPRGPKGCPAMDKAPSVNKKKRKS